MTLSKIVTNTLNSGKKEKGLPGTKVYKDLRRLAKEDGVN
jgi:hypothetical protein